MMMLQLLARSVVYSSAVVWYLKWLAKSATCRLLVNTQSVDSSVLAGIMQLANLQAKKEMTVTCVAHMNAKSRIPAIVWIVIGKVRM